MLQPSRVLQERSARLQQRSGNGVTIPVEMHVDRYMKPPVRPRLCSLSLKEVRNCAPGLALTAPAHSVMVSGLRYARPRSRSIAHRNADRSRPACVLQVYVYYHLHSFYQNHKRYVRSRNDAQLAGKTTAPGVKCQPEQFLGGNQAQPINPCGLIAWSLFNDSFTATVSNTASARSTLLNLNVRAPAQWLIVSCACRHCMDCFYHQLPPYQVCCCACCSTAQCVQHQLNSPHVDKWEIATSMACCRPRKSL